MNIFLAHASEDKGTADAIAFSLRSRGYKVFLDRDDLPAGKSYDQQIGQAVKKSDIFIFLISPDSVAEGRYTLTELTFARRKWNTPNARVLPVMVRKTPLDQVPAYLKAVTILEPLGNISAETSAAVDAMRLGRHAPAMAWLFAAELILRYRYILAVGAFCGCAGIFFVYAFNKNEKLIHFIGPILLQTGDTRALAIDLHIKGPVDIVINSIALDWTGREKQRAEWEAAGRGNTPELFLNICSASEGNSCPNGVQRGTNGTYRRELPAGPATVVFFNFRENPPVTFSATIKYPE